MQTTDAHRRTRLPWFWSSYAGGVLFFYWSFAMKYSEKLRDPRWQRKRLEVMEAAGFRCRWCEDETETLNVHHSYYEKGLEPWEYPNDSLHCLCESCHSARHELEARIARTMAVFDEPALLGIMGFVLGLRMLEYGPEAIADVPQTGDEFAGLARAWCLKETDIVPYRDGDRYKISYKQLAEARWGRPEVDNVPEP